jgi:hypothetical protein
MQLPCTAPAVAGLFLSFLVSPLVAQIDYRNLDDDRPVVTEDAYPVDRYAFEFLAPYRFEAEAGAHLHIATPELAYGLVRNAHIGVKVPVAAVDEGTGTDTDWGLAGLRIFGLYNFNTEGRSLPALSLRADAAFPVGSLAGEGTRFAIKAIATRSWGSFRGHLNASWGFGSEDELATAEPINRWTASLAVDRTLFRSSLLLVGEVAASQAIQDAPTELNASLGARWQWTPTLVLDAGLTRRLRSDVGPDIGLTIGLSHSFALRGLMPRGGRPVRVGSGTATSLTQRDEQFDYPGGFNWKFLGTYPEAARLFNAFDYGHAILYERLYTKRGRAGTELEKEYRFLTTDLLVRPPQFAVAEEVVMPDYAKIAWRAKMMFDWAHLLHRQIYDAYADDRLTPLRRDSLIERLTDYYLSNWTYAFTDKPKAMALMDEQYFSQTFRKAYPKFNGLIWAYHWLQVGLYEPFILGTSTAELKSGVQATVARFWSMLEDPPSRFPRYMPMASAIAPRFSAAHPRAAVIFDNLHMMHDIISDILAADTIPHDRKGEIINQQLDKLQDPSRDVMSLEEWRMMAEHMGGVSAMGGPATGLLREVPKAVTPITPVSPADSAATHEQSHHHQE